MRICDTAHSPCWEFSLFWMSPSQRERERERPVQLYEQTCDVAIAMDLEVAEVHLNCYCAYDNECVSLQGVSKEVRVYVLCVYFFCVSLIRPTQNLYAQNQNACWDLHIDLFAYSFRYFGLLPKIWLHSLLHWTHFTMMKSTLHTALLQISVQNTFIALFHADY